MNPLEVHAEVMILPVWRQMAGYHCTLNCMKMKFNSGRLA